MNEGSSKQVVAQIVTELQVTMLKPWRGRPHVLVLHSCHSAQMLIVSFARQRILIYPAWLSQPPLSPN